MGWELNRVIQADAVCLPLKDESVQCCITSPPYWGLRDYGTATWAGGKAECDHLGPPVRTQAGFNRRYFGKEFASDKQGDEREPMGQMCGKCGASRIDAQLGLERTPEEYVERMVAVFREVRRVLRDDGILWLNIGDSYATQPGKGGNVPQTIHKPNAYPTSAAHRSSHLPGLKPKDLVGIPWLVAFALRADGWYLRSDIVWNKTNPMPESVTDRPTKSHEYLFLMSKSAAYYYDAAAIQEPGTMRPQQRFTDGKGPKAVGYAPHRQPTGMTECAARNKRSVWTIATQPYPLAHFAVMPEALVAPCVLAGAPPGGIVLDPFAGSGTVGAVCAALKRQFIGVDLNAEYVSLAEARIGAAKRGGRISRASVQKAGQPQFDFS